ncbi:MAG: hypothetical protein IKS00_02365 [Bacteroidales bacterium]|nr:hypothetical protein [Bacteroidales bacterium]
MNLLKIGAIDIGSNGIRLYIANVLEDDTETKVYKSHIHRIPLRLGEDVFTSGRVSELKRINLIKIMQAFKLLMEVEQLKRFRVCATSALRDASNAAEIVADVKKFAGIDIDIISYEEESSLMLLSRKSDYLRKGYTYIYMDLGGGSLDITVFDEHQTITSDSFKLGTIRILKDIATPEEMQRCKNWLAGIAKRYSRIQLIGTGGNINKIFKLTNISNNEPLTLKKLQKLKKQLESYNYNDRMRFIELNPDRADVIIPAAELFASIMEWTGIHEITVPIVGLSDGIVVDQYMKYAADVHSGKKLASLEITQNVSEYDNGKLQD